MICLRARRKNKRGRERISTQTGPHVYLKPVKRGVRRSDCREKVLR